MSEPIYDDVAFAMITDEQRKDLIGQLWQYTLALEEYVIHLRNQVNTLSARQCLKTPSPDPASDFTMRFYDHPGFPEFAEVMLDEDPDWKISD